MSNKEIKNIRTYQAVKLDGKMDTFFTSERTMSKPAVKMEIESTIGVLISSNTDAVLVPFANISGVYFYTESDSIKKSEKEAADAHHEATKTKTTVNKIKVDPIGAKRL
jgi:hypothetical protein